MVDVAREAHADAIKFQTFHAEDVVIKSAGKAEYQKKTTGTDESQYEMIKKLELSERKIFDLAQYARTKNMMFLSTPFDIRSVDYLNSLGIPAFKIPSGEITNFLLLSHIAKKQKPVILSTGMATINEIKTAVDVLCRNGSPRIALLHCITSYPAEIRHLNLRFIHTLRKTFKCPIGFSDHSLGILGSIVAVAMGACIIEKHFTLDKALPGPDHKASLDPGELSSLVEGIRQIEQAKGTGIKIMTSGETEILGIARRSIVSVKNIRAGAIIHPTMITLKRPGTGIDPSFFDSLIGKKTKVRIPKDTLISWDMVE